MNLNLVFAIAWLIAAVILFTISDLSIPVGGTKFSSGWVALVLALYNVARWWSVRSARRQRLAEQEALAQRAHRNRVEERREPVEPDPNFNFKDPPAGQGDGPSPG
jgi:hypothetical protein